MCADMHRKFLIATVALYKLFLAKNTKKYLRDVLPALV